MRGRYSVRPPRRPSSLHSAVAFSLYLVVAAQGLGSARAADDPPTYSRDIAPILQQRCQPCHRPGQVGPFSLETYQQARKRAADVAGVAEARTMPPWMPRHGVGPRLRGDPSLTEEQIRLLGAWAEAGAPEGDPRDLPPPRQFPPDWQLGAPDVVLQPAEEFTIPASGPDIYRCFVIPTNSDHDLNLSAIEFRPSNRRVVHHLNAYYSTRKTGRELDAADPGPGYTSFSGPGFQAEGELGFWAAGNEPFHLPDGVARRLPRGSDLILQVHYHPTGKPEVDRTGVGLYFARGTVQRIFHWADATNVDFRIPPGRPNVEVKASWFVPEDVEALAVTPHMHQIGKDFRMTVAHPDGRTEDLLLIPAWDPDWQSTYLFEKPVTLPKGCVVNVVAHYDNTAHARNPNAPPRSVRWGPGVHDEMCVGYIGVIKKDQDMTRPGENDDFARTLAKQRWHRFLRERIADQRRN